MRDAQGHRDAEGRVCGGKGQHSASPDDADQRPDRGIADRPCACEPVRAKLVERAGVLPGAYARCVTAIQIARTDRPDLGATACRADMSPADQIGGSASVLLTFAGYSG